MPAQTSSIEPQCEQLLHGLAEQALTAPVPPLMEDSHTVMDVA